MTDAGPIEAQAPVPDELARLTALYGSGLLDDGPRATLDALVGLAASLLDCPALLTLVDRDETIVLTASGGDWRPAPRAISLCDHTIREPAGMVVPDLADDPRFAGGPLTDQLRFYAGFPVHAPDGAGLPRAIGALCLVGATPRAFDERGREALRHLAGLADVLIAARADAQCAVGIAVEHERLVGALARQHRLFAQAERMTRIGSWRLSLPDERIEWSEGLHRIYGVAPDIVPTLDGALAPYPPDARGRVAGLLAEAIERRRPFDFEEDFHSADGERRRVRCVGECEQVDGRATALVGVFQDVTERHRTETALRRDADTDALTGLANRAAFDTHLAAAIARARAGGDAARLLLVLTDLDGFKTVNDTLGHAAGDDLLRTVGTALRSLPLPPTVVARIGGDEFALLLERDTDDPAAIAEAVERALLLSASGNGLTLACSGSVGTALFGDETPREFFHRADLALYAAKRARIRDRRRTTRRRAA